MKQKLFLLFFLAVLALTLPCFAESGENVTGVTITAVSGGVNPESVGEGSVANPFAGEFSGQSLAGMSITMKSNFDYLTYIENLQKLVDQAYAQGWIKKDSYNQLKTAVAGMGTIRSAVDFISIFPGGTPPGSMGPGSLRDWGVAWYYGSLTKFIDKTMPAGDKLVAFYILKDTYGMEFPQGWTDDEKKRDLVDKVSLIFSAHTQRLTGSQSPEDIAMGVAPILPSHIKSEIDTAVKKFEPTKTVSSPPTSSAQGRLTPPYNTGPTNLGKPVTVEITTEKTIVIQPVDEVPDWIGNPVYVEIGGEKYLAAPNWGLFMSQIESSLFQRQHDFDMEKGTVDGVKVVFGKNEYPAEWRPDIVIPTITTVQITRDTRKITPTPALKVSKSPTPVTPALPISDTTSDDFMTPKVPGTHPLLGVTITPTQSLDWIKKIGDRVYFENPVTKERIDITGMEIRPDGSIKNLKTGDTILPDGTIFNQNGLIVTPTPTPGQPIRTIEVPTSIKTIALPMPGVLTLPATPVSGNPELGPAQFSLYILKNGVWVPRDQVEGAELKSGDYILKNGVWVKNDQGSQETKRISEEELNLYRRDYAVASVNKVMLEDIILNLKKGSENTEEYKSLLNEWEQAEQLEILAWQQYRTVADNYYRSIVSATPTSSSTSSVPPTMSFTDIGSYERSIGAKTYTSYDQMIRDMQNSPLPTLSGQTSGRETASPVTTFSQHRDISGSASSEGWYEIEYLPQGWAIYRMVGESGVIEQAFFPYTGGLTSANEFLNPFSNVKSVDIRTTMPPGSATLSPSFVPTPVGEVMVTKIETTGPTISIEWTGGPDEPVLNHQDLVSLTSSGEKNIRVHIPQGHSLTLTIPAKNGYPCLPFTFSGDMFISPEFFEYLSQQELETQIDSLNAGIKNGETAYIGSSTEASGKIATSQIPRDTPKNTPAVVSSPAPTPSVLTEVTTSTIIPTDTPDKTDTQKSSNTQSLPVPLLSLTTSSPETMVPVVTTAAQMTSANIQQTSEPILTVASPIEVPSQIIPVVTQPVVQEPQVIVPPVEVQTQQVTQNTGDEVVVYGKTNKTPTKKVAGTVKVTKKVSLTPSVKVSLLKNVTIKNTYIVK